MMYVVWQGWFNIALLPSSPNSSHPFPGIRQFDFSVGQISIPQTPSLDFGCLKYYLYNIRK